MTGRAVVTGGGSGIGAAAALALAAKGTAVGVIDVNGAAAARTAEEITAAGGRACHRIADVSREDEIAAAIDGVATELGGLDSVVANAGIEPTADDDRADRLDADVWRRVVEVNLTGVFLTCKHGIRHLLTGGGAVVCTASPTGLYGIAPGEDAYSASKAGVYGLIRVMANDYAKLGVRVNGVLPGYIETSLTAHITPGSEGHTDSVRGIPLGRTGTAAEVASVITFLVSDEASYVTGAVWAVDGGMTAV